jgi:hypothetical protein
MKILVNEIHRAAAIVGRAAEKVAQDFLADVAAEWAAVAAVAAAGTKR